jgi:hypothetical protein
LPAHAQHDQTDTTAIKVIYNPQQVRGAPRKAIGTAGHHRISAPNEAQGFLEPIALCHG